MNGRREAGARLAGWPAGWLVTVIGGLSGVAAHAGTAVAPRAHRAADTATIANCR